jgi:porin
MMRGLFLFVLIAPILLCADAADYGISGNPGAVNVLTGTGELGKILHIPDRSGVRLGGAWLGDYNALLTGGRGTGNSALILDLYIDLQKAVKWTGASFGAEFLQFNGQPTNTVAGAVQGYNSLPGSPPLNRSQLYQLWLLQEFWDKKLSVRIGKTVPTIHFNNVSKPVPTENPAISIPSVTGLIYTPIFTNPTMLGVIGGFYNSVYGIEATIAPIKELYVNMAVYDGSLAKGIQTGLTAPHFDGYYFYIMEAGYGWNYNKPGIAAIGGWYQSGLLEAGGQRQDGTGGIYGFGSQALWIKESTTVSKGNVSSFFQFGWNNSKTLEMNLFFGAGLTGFALIPQRRNDSFGVGVSWSRLNPHLFSRYSELMLQGYYQAQIYKTTYLQPVLSYIPNPGRTPEKSNVCAFTLRGIALF